MAVLRRVLIEEPMSAEAYYLTGRIHLQQGDRGRALNSLRTVLFFDNNFVDAYILLVKIYVEMGDCLQAKNLLTSAQKIDKTNQEVVGLERLVSRCSIR
jgi:lipopolysaccharide biosynthesis regulator YciM